MGVACLQVHIVQCILKIWVNPLSPKGDKRLISPYSTQLCIKSIWGMVGRICMWILGLKGLTRKVHTKAQN